MEIGKFIDKEKTLKWVLKFLIQVILLLYNNVFWEILPLLKTDKYFKEIFLQFLSLYIYSFSATTVLI